MGNETETDKDFAFDNMTENQFGKDENAAPAEPDEEAETEIELPYPVKLSKEYTVGKKTFSELVFKYPITVRLIKHLPAGDMTQLKVGHFIPVIAGMTEMPTVVIEALEPKDFTVCAEVASSFL